jgi:hypothetical protein
MLRNTIKMRMAIPDTMLEIALVSLIVLLILWFYPRHKHKIKHHWHHWRDKRTVVHHYKKSHGDGE